MQRCDWCHERSALLVPVVNRGANTPGEFEFLCSACAEVERFEHADEILQCPVTYQALTEGRKVVHLAA